MRSKRNKAHPSPNDALLKMLIELVAEVSPQRKMLRILANTGVG